MYISSQVCNAAFATPCFQRASNSTVPHNIIQNNNWIYIMLPLAPMPTFADRGCHVVSATDPRGR
jgi:hypothetical protein